MVGYRLKIIGTSTNIKSSSHAAPGASARSSATDDGGIRSRSSPLSAGAPKRPRTPAAAGTCVPSAGRLPGRRREAPRRRQPPSPSIASLRSVSWSSHHSRSFDLVLVDLWLRSTYHWTPDVVTNDTDLIITYQIASDCEFPLNGNSQCEYFCERSRRNCPKCDAVLI